MLAFLQDMENADELRTIRVWKAHMLSGNRKGVWSLHVTRNWRLTFWIDRQEDEICDLNFGRLPLGEIPCACRIRHILANL
jgi:proteic killer suppression protein